MKRIFLMFICISIIGCGTDVDRWTTYSYYVSNNTDSRIRIIGVSKIQTSSEIDTIIDTAISSEGQLHIYSGYDGFDAGVTNYSLNIEKCDSIFILKGNVYLNRSFNYRKYPSLINIDSSSTVFFQFENQDTWLPYDTTEFESEGPQPKEIFFKFVVK